MARPFRLSLACIALLALPAASATLSAQAATTTGATRRSRAVLDSAALAGDAAALDLELPRDVPPLFSIVFDSTGGVDTVRAMFDRIPAAYADPVVAAIRARLKPQPTTGRMLYTHVRVVTGPGARVDRPRLRENQPQLVNRGEISRLLSSAAGRHTSLLMMGPRTARVKFRVRADGTSEAESAQLTLSSGNPQLDDEAVAVVGRMRFRPANVEGIPVRVWVQVPITFQLQTPPPPSVRPRS